MTPEDLNRFIAVARAENHGHDLPLKHVRIIDMATVIAAPFAATLLADYGAEVIKIENPDRPDAIRNWGVIEEKQIQPFWSVIGRNKYPVTLNLKMTEGRDIFMKLVRQTDVLIENLRPGAMEKLGITRELLMQENPGLIIGTVSGFGATGPYAKRPGFGTLAEAFSGFTYLNAQPGEPPTNAPLALADFVAGTHLALGVLVALHGQKRGKCGGQTIDVSLYEPLFSMLGPDFLSYSLTGKVPQPQGNELSYVVPRNNYRTRDDKWVSLSCSAQKPFERLMECIGHPEMISDPRFEKNEMRIRKTNRKIINDVVAEWISDRDLEEVITICDNLGITIGPIATMEDIDRNEHYRERGSTLDIEDPATGRWLKLPNLPFRLMATPGKIRFPGLPHGSANREIYQGLMGFSSEKLSEMAEAGVI